MICNIYLENTSRNVSHEQLIWRSLKRERKMLTWEERIRTVLLRPPLDKTFKPLKIILTTEHFIIIHFF